MDYKQKLNDHFIHCFLKGWENLSRDDKGFLQKRKHVFNKDFVFTEAAITILRIIDLTLQNEELRIWRQLEKIIALQKKWVKKKLIDDYAANVSIHCFNENFYSQWHPEFAGNLFFSAQCFMHSTETQDEIFYTDNWNKFHNEPGHPLTNDFHCFSFHYLYNHTPLSWEDILRIDEIKLEIKISNQFFIKLNS